MREQTHSKTGGDTAHDDGDEVVKISVGRGGELEGSEADVVPGRGKKKERVSQS